MFITILLILLVAVVVAATRFPPTGMIWGGPMYPDLHKVQKNIHAYSGINPRAYMKYLVNIDNCEEQLEDTPQAVAYLDKAIANIRNIGLNLPAGDTEIPEQLETLGLQLGKITEQYIMNYALQGGKRFNPRYLNNIFIDIKAT